MIRFLHHCSQLTSSSQIQSSVFLGGTASGQGGTPYVCMYIHLQLRDCGAVFQFPAREMLHKTPANEGPSGWDMSRFPSMSLSAKMEQPCTPYPEELQLLGFPPRRWSDGAGDLEMWEGSRLNTKWNWVAAWTQPKSPSRTQCWGFKVCDGKNPRSQTVPSRTAQRHGTWTVYSEQNARWVTSAHRVTCSRMKSGTAMLGPCCVLF
jgi:hypothetical protein